MDSNYLVTVIMPVYNAEKYIARALESIINQTYTNIEILIADDASTDGSKQLIDNYNDIRIKRHHNSENLGYLRTCNRLFRLASGDFIAFQDADDWSDIHRIENIMGFLMGNPNISLCGCNFIRLNDETGKIISKSNYPEKDEEIKKFIESKKTLPFCGASVIFKRSLYLEIGGYRDFYHQLGYEHFDWFMLACEKYIVANLPSALYYYRYNKNSFSRSNRLTNFKKYYISEIAWFLKLQRLKTGKDALQDINQDPDFQHFLSSLERDFWSDRNKIYRNVIFQMLSNKDTGSATKTIGQGLRNKEISFLYALFLFFRVLRTALAKLTYGLH